MRTFVTSSPTLYNRRICLPLLAATLMAVVGCGARASPAEEAAGLLHVLLGERFTVGRASGATAWAPCSVIDSVGIIPRLTCGEELKPGSERFERLAAAERRVRPDLAESNPADLRVMALLDLRWRESSPAAVERAVQAMEHAARLAPDDPAVLNDLSLAYLAKAERDQQLAPMLRALDAADQALARDSLLAPALFNRALILERLYLVDGARAGWFRYRAVERSPLWRAEADRHLRRLTQVADTVSWDGLIAGPPPSLDARARAGIAARVRRSPQSAREAGSFALLREWGIAELRGERDRAARLLAVCREISRQSRALGVDGSVGLAVQAIDSAEGAPSRRRTLATGHVLLGDGFRQFSLARYDSAGLSLARAERMLGAAGSPAARWARFYRGAAGVNSVDYVRGDRLLGRVLAEAGPDEPTLVGKALWALGVSQLRRGNYGSATRLYDRAEPYIARSREAENQGALALLLAEGLSLAGQTVPGETEAYRALRLLSPFRRSNFLSNHLAIVASSARAQGLRFAALDLTDEMVGVAKSVAKPNVVALALCARARDYAATGRRAAARADVEQAVYWAARIGHGPGRDRLQANVSLARGQLARRDDPGAALPLLADAVATYRGFKQDLYLPVALYEAAQAAAATRDTARALEWLRQAVDHIEGQQESFTSTEVRATFAETVENVFDALIAIELARGRSTSAFELLERSRTAAWRGTAQPAHGSGTPSPPTLARVKAALPADMLLIEYALLPDQLVIWTASSAGWRERRVAMGRDSVAALVERFAREAAQARPGPGGADARLYDLLLRPVASELRGVHRLAVVPDRELGRLPFAALRDTATGRYVVQTLELRTLPSTAFFLAATAGARPTQPVAATLVVGNPALDAAARVTLPDLPGAAREAVAVAALYGGQPLTRAAATRGAVLRLLPQTSIFHFAGHAVMNSEQPELSYLALAPDGTRGDGNLPAREIGELRLSNMQVVVLSACSSLTPRATHTGAVAGLAYSFLRAGSPATVSTLWDVDDAATTPLLVDFHRRLAAGVPAPEALRLAQVDALKSREHAPQGWAAFIYTGP